MGEVAREWTNVEEAHAYLADDGQIGLVLRDIFGEDLLNIRFPASMWATIMTDLSRVILAASQRRVNPNVRPDDHFDMEEKKPFDTAAEPVDVTGEDEFMDTGVLHEDADDKASASRETWPPHCGDPECQRKHPHAPPQDAE